MFNVLCLRLQACSSKQLFWEFQQSPWKSIVEVNTASAQLFGQQGSEKQTFSFKIILYGNSAKMLRL